ncbi:YcaO-like family protein, partial [Streptomyces alkaliphilus]|uniref:YcaO-like family protein n=1 Tax=Streptomyces alkaliphilus TaxID=1472722 RepID=UPI0012952DAE
MPPTSGPAGSTTATPTTPATPTTTEGRPVESLGPVEPVDPVEAVLGPDGVVARVVRDRPREPAVPLCVSHTAHLVPGPGVVDPATGGAALGDPDRSRRAAVGEAVERLCGNAAPDHPRADEPLRSHEELTRAGRPALDPRALVLYSRGQYAARGFPFVPFERNLPVAWTTGHDLRRNTELLVPASLVWVNRPRDPSRPEPPVHHPPLAGTAADPDPDRARAAALREVLERDAVTRWWIGGAPAHRLFADAPPGDDPGAVALRLALEQAAGAGLRVGLLRVPCPVGVVVAAAFIEDPARRLVAFGSACRPTAVEAAAKAFTEAIGTHEASLELLDPDSGFHRAVRAGRVDPRPFRPHRADRRYALDFRPDLRDVNDVRLHLQLHLDPAVQDARLDRLRRPLPATAPPDGAEESVGADLPALLDLTDRHGLRVIAADLTTPRVRRHGWHVARVIVPGLVGNAPAAFPFLGFLTDPDPNPTPGGGTGAPVLH